MHVATFLHEIEHSIHANSALATFILKWTHLDAGVKLFRPQFTRTIVAQTSWNEDLWVNNLQDHACRLSRNLPNRMRRLRHRKAMDTPKRRKCSCTKMR